MIHSKSRTPNHTLLSVVALIFLLSVATFATASPAAVPEAVDPWGLLPAAATTVPP